jgi:cytochrome c oxidase subunit 1
MPRRVYTYLPETGWGALNLVAGSGALLMAAGSAVFVANFLWSRRHGLHAGRDPWGADTLEWSTESPPPAYAFARLPVVADRHPLWAGIPGVVSGTRTHERDVLVTDALDARPAYVYGQPKPSIWPFLSALAVGATFIGVIFTPWALPAGSVLVGLVLVGWFWPKPDSPPPSTNAPRTPEKGTPA